MELFHYHYWTDEVEETEHFYCRHGFQLIQRLAKMNGGMQSYPPNLCWDEFRSESPQFRIIEVRKGKINVTFGAGKRKQFDHIGFLVSDAEHDELCHRANERGWNVTISERRTFIGTPMRLRIELQKRHEVVESKLPHIKKMKILTPKINEARQLLDLHPHFHDILEWTEGDYLHLVEVLVLGEWDNNPQNSDPNGVRLKVRSKE